MKSFRNITILLLLIVLLPVLFFSVYEISRITRTEKELMVIYNKQLEAILFSINLYSEDILNSWASRINYPINGDIQSINTFLEGNPQVESVGFTNDSAADIRLFSVTSQREEWKDQIRKIILDSAQRIQRLKTYYRAGYRKIDPLGINPANSSVYSFYFSGNEDSLGLVVLEINSRRFINELLGQKIQITAENRMTIGIVERESSKNIYQVGKLDGENKFQAQKPLWLFPQYNIGISLRDQDLLSLSKQKSRTLLYFILFVDLMFIVAALLVFRNIRKEILLAKIKSDFISNVSHEIRTPIALISMYSETLEMNRISSEEKKKEYHKVIFFESQRLAGIVNRILNFSKLESGKRTYSLNEFDLNDLVEKIMNSYSYHLNVKGFEYELELSPEAIIINADYEALSDVFLNLLDNAIKYSNAKKTIHIKTGVKADMAFFEIGDKGIGIAPQHHKLIFDKFFRVAKGDLAYHTKGTGLGLTIVKNIVDFHKGKIEVESKLGEGSVFRVLIPKANIN